jgi:hypothetical protein
MKKNRVVVLINGTNYIRKDGLLIRLIPTKK